MIFIYSITKRVGMMLYCSAFHGESSGGAQSYLGNYYFFHYCFKDVNCITKIVLNVSKRELFLSIYVIELEMYKLYVINIFQY